MEKFLFDHALEIIAVIVAVVIFYLQLRRKSLVYSVITNSSVVSILDNVKDNIQVMYKGNIVSSVYFIEIRITNKGNLPIKPDEYIVPLTIQFRTETKILSVEIIDPHQLGIQSKVENSSIILSKTLLNPQDSFDIKLLVGNTNSDVSVNGRIVGLQKLHKDTPSAASKIASFSNKPINLSETFA